MNTQHPTPNTKSPAPNTKSPIPNTQPPIPNTQYPIPNTQYQIPNPQPPTPNILLVDDDLFVLKSIGPFLESLGYHVTTAQSGEDAIELLNRSTFDLVVTDLIMGDVDGYQVLETAKKLRSETMVIVLTGHSDPTFIVNALRLGADDYLIKPCEPEEMRFRVERCLEKLEIKKKAKQAEEALRESEARLKALSEASFEAIFFSEKGVCLDQNQSGEKLFGYSHSEAVGRHGMEWIVPEDREKVNNNMLAGYEAPYEVNGLRKNGTTFPCEIQGRILDYHGRSIRVTALRDISKQKRMQEELLKAKKLESLGVLAGGIAHDFNNLMSAVLGYITLAGMEVEPGSEAFKLLFEAEKASVQTKELTARLITFSEGGGPVKETASICNLIKDFVDSFLKDSDVSCNFSIPDHILPVEVDEEQIKQVIRNIITNARESMAEQGTINVSCENVDKGVKDTSALKNSKYIKISIEDRGSGIPEKDLPKIFDPYFSTKEKGTQKGMGLGLAVSDSIVKKHNGLITAESEVGSGSTFHIYLPAETVKNQSGNTEHDGRTSQSTINNQQSPIQTVLVMDDEEVVREVSHALLTHMGYEAEVAVEGVEAIEIYGKAMESEKPFDMVILDLTNKVGMGGVETIVRLLEIDPGVRAIVASGYSNDPIISNFREHGFCGALPKPFTMDQLKRALHDALAKKSKV